jgi:hypothetical protein
MLIKCCFSEFIEARACRWQRLFNGVMLAPILLHAPFNTTRKSMFCLHEESSTHASQTGHRHPSMSLGLAMNRDGPKAPSFMLMCIPQRGYVSSGSMAVWGSECHGGI